MQPGTFSAEQIAQLDAALQQARDIPGPLMPVLQKAQDIFGYLPPDVQTAIARGLGVPEAEVYGVATFYSQFTMQPRGAHVVSVCMGTACYVKNVQAVMDELCAVLDVQPGKTTKDGRFTLEPTRCLGCCGLAPVIMIDDAAYGNLKPSDVKGIIERYNEGGATK